MYTFMFFEQAPTQEQTLAPAADVAAPSAEATPEPTSEPTSEPSLIPGVAQEHINNNFDGLIPPENAHNLRRGG